jgi:hypothetical protein
MASRIAALEHIAGQHERAVAGRDYVLREDVNGNRVAFVFHAIPEQCVRDLMTRNGFVFDRRRALDGQVIWGRKRTPTAITTAQRLLPELNALMNAVMSSAAPMDHLAPPSYRFTLTHEVTALDEVAT